MGSGLVATRAQATGCVASGLLATVYETVALTSL